jgi:hypothetical protein
MNRAPDRAAKTGARKDACDAPDEGVDYLMLRWAAVTKGYACPLC